MSSQASVGAIVPGGAADVDGLRVGDEIIRVNHHDTTDVSHSMIISFMTQAAASGEMTLRIRRKMPLAEPPFISE